MQLHLHYFRQANRLILLLRLILPRQLRVDRVGAFHGAVACPQFVDGAEVLLVVVAVGGWARTGDGVAAEVDDSFRWVLVQVVTSLLEYTLNLTNRFRCRKFELARWGWHSHCY